MGLLFRFFFVHKNFHIMKRQRKITKDSPVCFADMPTDIVNLILHTYVRDDDNATKVHARRVNKQFKKSFDIPCSGYNCSTRHKIVGALVHGRKDAINHMMNHSIESNDLLIELFLSANSSKLIEVMPPSIVEKIGIQLLIRLIQQGDVECIFALLELGVDINLEVVLAACFRIQDHKDDGPMSILLSYPPEDDSLKCALFNDNVCESESNISQSLDRILRSEALSHQLKNLNLNRAFQYLLAWDKRLRTPYSYKKAFLTALHTSDLDFCENMISKYDLRIQRLPHSYTSHLARLNWHNILDQALRSHPDRSIDALMIALNFNKLESFNVALNIATKSINQFQYREEEYDTVLDEDDDDIKTRKMFFNRLKPLTHRCFELNRDEMLAKILLVDEVSEFVTETNIEKLLTFACQREMNKSMCIMIQLATRKNCREFDYLKDNAEMILNWAMDCSYFELLRDLLSLEYIPISTVTLLRLCGIIRTRTRDDNDESDNELLQQLAEILDSQLDLFKILSESMSPHKKKRKRM